MFTLSVNPKREWGKSEGPKLPTNVRSLPSGPSPPDTLLEGPDGKCTRGMQSPLSLTPSDMSVCGAEAKLEKYRTRLFFMDRLFVRAPSLLRRERTMHRRSINIDSRNLFPHSLGEFFPPDANMSIIHPFSALWQRRRERERERRLRRPPTMKMVIAPSFPPSLLPSLPFKATTSQSGGRTDGARCFEAVCLPGRAPAPRPATAAARVTSNGGKRRRGEREGRRRLRCRFLRGCCRRWTPRPRSLTPQFNDF